MERICFTFEIYEGTEDEYKKRHDEIWPELVADIQKAGFKNYSLFRRGTRSSPTWSAIPTSRARSRAWATATPTSRWAEWFKEIDRQPHRRQGQRAAGAGGLASRLARLAGPSGSRRAPRIALLSPYWTFWEPSARIDLRADRLGLARARSRRRCRRVEVVAAELVDGREAGAAAGERSPRRRPTRCSCCRAWPCRRPTRSPRSRPCRPRRSWCGRSTARTGCPTAFDHSDITTEGATVGTPHADQRPAPSRAPARARGRPAARPGVPRCASSRRSRAATAAGRLRRARIARVGRPIDGYDCVDVDARRPARGDGHRARARRSRPRSATPTCAPTPRG